MINTTETSKVVTSLQPGSNYWFSIRSVGKEGQLSSPSDIVNTSTCKFSSPLYLKKILTFVYKVPVAPSMIELQVGPTNSTFSWIAVKGLKLDKMNLVIINVSCRSCKLYL